MSIRIMSQIWECGPTKQGHLLVMLALADYANDSGECWPSIKSIAEKARMTDRGVQKILRTLEAENWLQISTGNGRHGCNQYRINPERRHTPERRSPRTTMQETPNDDAETPNVGTPEPSITINEPSEEDNAGADQASMENPKPPQKARLPDCWTPSDEDVEYALSQKLTHEEIKEIADDFHAYWADRTDSGGRKSARGWRQTWRNRVRDQAPKFLRNRLMAGKQVFGGSRQGGSIASAAARRRANGEV